MTTPNRIRRDPTIPLAPDDLECWAAKSNAWPPFVQELALEIIALREEHAACLAAVRHVAKRIRREPDFRYIAGAATQTLALVCAALATDEPRDASEIEDLLLAPFPTGHNRIRFTVEELANAFPTRIALSEAGISDAQIEELLYEAARRALGDEDDGTAEVDPPAPPTVPPVDP